MISGFVLRSNAITRVESTPPLSATEILLSLTLFSISKEIEYQTLEIQLSEKRMKEFEALIVQKKEVMTTAEEGLNERKKDLDHKKKELDSIVKETEKEEKALVKASEEAADSIEERLLSAYKRIRGSVKNGLAVVPVERGSSGGSFIKIPPQRQLDIAARKKINTYREQYAYNRNITFMPAITSTSVLTYARRVSASPLSTGPPRDHGALHRHRHASATTLRLVSLSPRGILQWPEEQSRSGCGQDGGNADQSQHRRMWRCRSSCPLILARPSPPCQPSCSQPPPPPRRSLV